MNTNSGDQQNQRSSFEKDITLSVVRKSCQCTVTTSNVLEAGNQSFTSIFPALWLAT